MAVVLLAPSAVVVLALAAVLVLVWAKEQAWTCVVGFAEV